MNKLLRAALALLTVSCSLSTISAQTLNVATYNLRFDTKADGANAWPHRVEAIRRQVAFHDWDVFGTQEGLRHQLEQLTVGGDYAFTGVGRDDGDKKGEHSAIVYRTSRLRLLSEGTFWLSETPDEPSYGWDAQSYRRICSWARFRDRATGRRFWFFCVHYDHVARRAPVESSRLVMARIEEMTGGEATILVGDFNSTPRSKAVREVAARMRDSFSEVAPYGPRRTYNGFRTGSIEPSERIDYVFVTPGVEVVRCGVLTDVARLDPLRWPSDHFPVMVELRITR